MRHRPALPPPPAAPLGCVRAGGERERRGLRRAPRRQSRSHHARHPGAARGRQDVHRRADDLRPGPRGQEGRRHRHQPQGDSQPAGRRVTARSGARVWAPVQAGTEAEATERRMPGQSSESHENPNALARSASGEVNVARRHRVAVGARFAGGRRAVRGRGRTDVAGQRARRLAGRATASCCSAIRSSSSSRRRAAIPTASACRRCEHVLGGHQTMPADRGIFLPETWRLSPEICAFTSELFYEGRLTSKPASSASV